MMTWWSISRSISYRKFFLRRNIWNISVLPLMCWTINCRFFFFKVTYFQLEFLNFWLKSRFMISLKLHPFFCCHFPFYYLGSRSFGIFSFLTTHLMCWLKYNFSWGNIFIFEISFSRFFKIFNSCQRKTRSALRNYVLCFWEFHNISWFLFLSYRLI